MSSLVVRYEFLLTHRLLNITLSTHNNALIDILSNVICDSTITVLDSANSTLVEKVCEISTRETSRLFRDSLESHVGCKLLTPRMDTEDLEATLYTWKGHLHLTVEPTGAKQCVVEDINSVCSSNHHDTSLIVKTIHLREELLMVCSRSSFPGVPFPPRFLPTASISSMKMIHG